MSKISQDFFLREDVLQISQDLLGKYLYTCIDGVVTSGIIVETEAYMAPADKASHAFNNKRTPRTDIFYHEGGKAYVYLCYGIHHLFNIITNQVNIPHAVLIRAVQPIEGIDTMLQRRNKIKIDYALTSGPGALSVALGINKSHNGISLLGNVIWLEEKEKLSSSEIVCGPRVGVSYAGDFAEKPWRFGIKNNPWISKPKILP